MILPPAMCTELRSASRLRGPTTLGAVVFLATVPVAHATTFGTLGNCDVFNDTSRGWRLNAKRTTWTYTDATRSLVDGITRRQIQDSARKLPRQVRVTLRGRNGTYPVTAGTSPCALPSRSATHRTRPPCASERALSWRPTARSRAAGTRYAGYPPRRRRSSSTRLPAESSVGRSHRERRDVPRHDRDGKVGVDMPITEQVFHVLHKRRPLLEALRILLSRDYKEELVGIK